MIEESKRRPPFDVPWAIDEHSLTLEDRDAWRKHRARGKSPSECSDAVLEEIEDQIASGHRDRYGRRVIPYNADRVEWNPDEVPPVERWEPTPEREPGEDDEPIEEIDDDAIPE